MPEYGLYNGAWTGPEIDAAIGRSARISNPNLLDNAYFIGGGGDGKFPINQRGYSSYTGATYTIDRWKLMNGAGTLSLTSGGIVFSNSASGYGYMEQAWELGDNVSGMQLTLSVLANGVLYSSTGSFNITLPSGLLFYKANANTAVNIRIPANLVSSETITAIKVEVGNQQTLAHQEGTSWVLNEIPNYVEELAKCQRYFVRYPTIILTGISPAAGKAVGTSVVTPQPMRTTIQSVSGTPLWVRWPTSGNLTSGFTTDFTNAAVNNNYVEGISVSHNSIPAITLCAVQWSNLTISCEL